MKQNALEACLESLERWQREHESAMTALDIEELYITLMSFYRAVGDHEDLLESRALAAGHGVESFDSAGRDAARGYELWLKAAEPIERLIAQSDAMSYESSLIEPRALARAIKQARGAIRMASLPGLSKQDQQALDENVKKSVDEIGAIWRS